MKKWPVISSQLSVVGGRWSVAAGQSLIELVVAIGVVVLLVTGVVVATTMALRAGQAGKRHSLAVKYAQEGIELVRSLRDSSWTDFVAKSGIWCLAKDGTWTSSGGSDCPVNIDNTFTRQVLFAWDGGLARMTATVTVAWLEAGGSRSTVLTSYFTEWRQK